MHFELPAQPALGYRGRLAPSPTGYLHLGHARTFWTAQERARAADGILIVRNEDLDRARCKPRFVAAMLEDLRWFGFQWQEGPDCGGPFTPYNQGERVHLYRAALERLRTGGFIYPCTCSRKDIQAAAGAPHAGDEEPIYPGTCRPKTHDRTLCSEPGNQRAEATASLLPTTQTVFDRISPAGVFRHHWRFRVPDGETICFKDGHFGAQRFVAGIDFGDFVVWRNDGVPSYQLAVVVDDAAMQISEVVRGADLLLSTARQLLLYHALGLKFPSFYHCSLLTDGNGLRLAKRHDALSLRCLREQNRTPKELRAGWARQD